MRVIPKGSDELLNFPSVCVFTGTSDADLLDTGFELNAKEYDGVKPYAYIEVGFLKGMAREVGMVDGEALEAAEARIAELEKALPKAAAWDAMNAVRDKVAA
jgi:hypothetical protein